MGVSAVTNGFFQNQGKGWVMATLSESGSGALFHTTDGGQSWVSHNPPFSGGYIQFLDDTQGFALSGEPSGMNKQAVSLYQTSDGGATWTRSFTNAPTDPAANDSLPFSGHKNGMAFRDATHGWVGGDVPRDGFVYLYATADGGASWTQQALALPTGYESAFISTTAPSFFGAKDAVLPVWMTTGVGARDLFIYVTHDGGATWAASSSFAREARDANFASMRDAFSWDEANLIHVTHDSGNSWSEIKPNVTFGDYYIPALDFVSATTGWIVQGHANGYTSLYRTTDGGLTWTLLSTNLPP